MQGFGGQNTHIIEAKNHKAILGTLAALGIKSAHFNNGTFALPQPVRDPGMLSAFKYMTDHYGTKDDAIIVAINSDASMRNAYVNRPNVKDLLAQLAPEGKRAQTVVKSLGALYPDRKVVAMFYNEETPLELYTALDRGGFGITSLHKLGYGTSKDDKPIIGGHLAKHLVAFPLLNNNRPVLHHETRDAKATDRQPDKISDLTKYVGPHEAPYATREGVLLFPLPQALKKYGPSSDEGRKAAFVP